MNEGVRVFIGLGSNLGDPIDHLRGACVALQALPKTTWVKCSRFFRSKPFGPVAQADFVNAVVEVYTQLSPDQLLTALQQIEQQHGRDRSGPRWGPRSLDLDLLLYGNARIETPALRVPHPGIAERNFVVYPMAELVDELFVPGVGWLHELRARLSLDGLQVFDA